MYLIKSKNPNQRLLAWRKKKIIPQIIPHKDVVEQKPQLSEIDMPQTGSGMKGIRNKLKALDLHSDAKRKYNKFISLKL
jgi:hypothetical protein